MKCPNCGVELSYGAQFCSNCGEKIAVNTNTGYQNYNYGTKNSNGYTPQGNNIYNDEPQSAEFVPCNPNYGGSMPGYGQPPRQNNNTPLIIIVCIIAVITISCIILGGIWALSSITNDVMEEGTEEVVEFLEEDYDDYDDEDDYKYKRKKKETTLPPVSEKPTQTPKQVTKPGEAKKQFFTVQAGNIELYSKSLDYDSMPQQELNSESGIVFEKWDNLLNDVYKFLKQIKSADEFKKIEQDEIEWIKEKEAAMEKERQAWQGGSGQAYAVNSVGIEYTRERCYYLISLIA